MVIEKKNVLEFTTAYLINEIRKVVYKGHVTGVLLVDLSNPFDTLGHSRLITKVQSYRIKSQSLQWFTYYLFARHQMVKLNREILIKFPLRCGVPQGLILGPILFLMLFNDSEDSLNFGKSIHFADNTAIYYSGEMLNHDLPSIFKYLKCNKL